MEAKSFFLIVFLCLLAESSCSSSLVHGKWGSAEVVGFADHLIGTVAPVWQILASIYLLFLCLSRYYQVQQRCFSVLTWNKESNFNATLYLFPKYCVLGNVDIPYFISKYMSTCMSTYYTHAAYFIILRWKSNRIVELL